MEGTNTSLWIDPPTNVEMDQLNPDPSNSSEVPMRRRSRTSRFATSMYQGVKEVERSERYSCKPPKLFIITITLIQMMVYLIFLWKKSSFCDKTNVTNRLVFNPKKTGEVWRFFTYMFLHANMVHLGWNFSMQLIFGLPLEMSQKGWIGSAKVALVFFSGVILGSMGSGVSEKNLIEGSSAGTYALISAHMGSLILNWKEDGEPQMMKKIRNMKALFVLLFFIGDLLLTIYNTTLRSQDKPISRAGHAFGALAGLLLGLYILDNRKPENWESKWLKPVTMALFNITWIILLIWHIVIGVVPNM